MFIVEMLSSSLIIFSLKYMLFLIASLMKRLFIQRIYKGEWAE